MNPSADINNSWMPAARRAWRWCAVLLGIGLASGAAAGRPAKRPVVVQFRARVVKVTPEQPTRIHWRWGGEGLGGTVTAGELTRRLPNKPIVITADVAKTDDLQTATLEEDPGPKDRVIIEGDTYNYHYLKPGTWTWLHPIDAFARARGRLFVTLTLEGHETARGLTETELELEFLHAGKVFKRVRIFGPDGPTFGLVVPYSRLAKDGAPTPEFVKELGSLRDYVRLKAAALEEMPWAKQPVPKRYAFLTDCAGYRPGSGYGCRTTDRGTMMAEYSVLRLMGINGIRGAPAFLADMIRQREGIGPELSRLKMVHTIGYPIPSVKRADGKPPVVHPGDGCPYHPDNVAKIPERVQTAVDHLIAEVGDMPVEEVWALTKDEIGTVFDGAPEGKAHQGCCPHCSKAFRAFVQADGRTLEDFGAPSWDDIHSTYGYWARTYWDIRHEREEAKRKAREAVDAELQAALGAGTNDLLKLPANGIDNEVVDALDNNDGEKRDLAAEFLAADKSLTELIWNNRAGQRTPKDAKHRLSPAGWNLLSYYSSRFNCEGAAQLFNPVREAFAAQNEKKRLALANNPDSPAAKQPWVYSYALRGNTFLMGGHSLDFFEFYRHADNAFMYETSNRDRRIWQWDSYLCDVGRSLNRFMGKRFGVYVKPHRGAPVQRAFTAIARGARTIYWYTYGPEWKKGDTFGGKIYILQKLGWAARLVARAEDVTYDSDWAVPAEVALVRPLTSKIFSGSANWENGKWVYTALNHAHIPVVPLDEGLVMSQDLSAYKMIVVSGSHLRRDAAAKLRDYVENGGVLYAAGWGLAEDEARQPLDVLRPVLGLKSRGEMDTWATVPRYGATSLRAIRAKRPAPEGANVIGQAPFRGSFTPAVGREILDPADGAQVLARYADGGAAVVRNRYGKGVAWTVGFYPGMEYAFEPMHNKPYDADKRLYVEAPVRDAGVRPVVDASVPEVDGVLLKNKQTGKLAVILINWKFTIDEPVRVAIRGAAGAKRVTSLALEQSLPVQREAGKIVVELPRLDEGDILLLE